MPGKKTMEQAKKLGMKGKGYKKGKTIPSYNDVVKKKTGGKVG